MKQILACVDSSVYAMAVCDVAGWASRKLDLPVELLHVVPRRDVAAQRKDLSGAIGLGVKSALLEELVSLEATDAKMQIERGRALLKAAAERVGLAGATGVKTLHRHGGIVETILEHEADARVVVIGKRGGSHEFATDHIGSKIERVVRASKKSILVASRNFTQPTNIVLAYDGSPAAKRALERCANSPLLRDLPVHIVMAGKDDTRHREMLDDAAVQIEGREVTTTLADEKPEPLLARTVEAASPTILVMGAYGHSPLRTLIVGSTTTDIIRTVKVPLLLTR